MNTLRTEKIKIQNESFSDWRSELYEVVGDIDDNINKDKQIKEKSNINNKIVINPTFKEAVENLGGENVEIFELNEDYLEEIVETATEYFYQNGINEYGLETVIEELGLEKFVDYLFYISEDYYLIEAKRSKSSAEARARLKADKAASREKAKQNVEARKKAQETPQTVEKKITVDKVNRTMDNAKKSQPSKKPVRDAIARGIFGAVDAYKRGMERHKKAVSDAHKTTETIKKAASVAHKGAKEFASGVRAPIETTKLGRDVQAAAIKGLRKGTRSAVQAAAKVAAKSKVEREKNKAEKKLQSEAFKLYEKAESQAQQKIFGLALSVIRGTTPRSEVSPEVLKIVDTMSQGEIRKFAKTPHKNLPKKA